MTSRIFLLLALLLFSSLLKSQETEIEEKTIIGKRNFIATNPVRQKVLTSYEFQLDAHEKCGSGIIHNQLMENNPAYKARFEHNLKLRKEFIANKPAAYKVPPIYEIPVVFHVIHKGEAVGVGTNISDAQLQSAIDAINRDFRRTSADGGIAQGNGPDTEIQFCLASVDPNGNSHSGINRVNGTSVTNYATQGIVPDISGNETAVKNLSKWPTADYVNVWIVSEINNSNADGPINNYTGGTLGFAYAGANLNNPNDGIVVVHNSCGNDPNGIQGYNLWGATVLGRTLTHEMGHHFGLLHPFAGSCTEFDCNNEGDYICDTPPAVQLDGSGSLSGCNLIGGNQCTNQQLDNYMDYFTEDCQNLFTQDQTDFMRATIATIRTGLTQGGKCVVPSPPIADFSASGTQINTGSSVVFTDLSTAVPAPNSWSWNFGDGGTSTQQNPTHTYNTAGTYTVILTVGNGSGSDIEVKTDYIEVKDIVLPPNTNFTANTTQISPGGTISFTDLTTANPAVDTWSWSFGDGGISTQQNPSYTYSSAGIYTVSLTASGGSGSDTETKNNYIEVISNPNGASCNESFNMTLPTYAINGVPSSFDAALFDNDGLTPNTSLPNYTTDWMVFRELVAVGDTNDFLRATSWFTNPGNASNWIIFGPFDLFSGAGELKWKHRIISNNFRDGYQIMISQNGNTISDFLTANEVVHSYNDNDSQTSGDTLWTENAVFLDSTIYGGKQIYVAFNHNAFDQFLLDIDDVRFDICGKNNIIRPTEIDDVELANSIKIFPNPSKGIFNITSSDNFSPAIDITVYNILGEKVYTSISELSANTVTIDLSDYASGMYSIAVQHQFGTVYKKVLLQD